MPEAWGNLAIKMSSKLSEEIISEGEEIDAKLIMKLLMEAGINRKDAEEGLDGTDSFLLEDEPRKIGEYLCLSVFGDEWMRIAGAIVEDGKGQRVALYGKILDEFLSTEFYAFDGKSNRFLKAFEGDGDESPENNRKMEEDTVKQWLTHVPRSLHTTLLEGGDDCDEDEAEDSDDEGDISGLHIVFTGKMLEGLREDMESLATDAGAIVQKAVNGKTDLLVVGEKVGEKKLGTAKELGIKIITERQFLNRIGQ